MFVRKKSLMKHEVHERISVRVPTNRDCISLQFIALSLIFFPKVCQIGRRCVAVVLVLFKTLFNEIRDCLVLLPSGYNKEITRGTGTRVHGETTGAIHTVAATLQDS